MAKDQPGMMMYWEMFDTLDRVKPEKLKPLLRAMRNLSQYGEIPDFSDDEALELVWPLIEQKIVADCARYEKIRKQRTDAVNARWEKERSKVSSEYECIQPNTGVYEDERNIPTSTTTSSSTATSIYKGDKVEREEGEKGIQGDNKGCTPGEYTTAQKVPHSLPVFDPPLTGREEEIFLMAVQTGMGYEKAASLIHRPLKAKEGEVH